jgi:hypothetical protein
MDRPFHVTGQVVPISNNPADNDDRQVGRERREQTDMSSGTKRSAECTVHQSHSRKKMRIT